jgi:hypothetical protein
VRCCRGWSPAMVVRTSTSVLVGSALRRGPGQRFGVGQRDGRVRFVREAASAAAREKRARDGISTRARFGVSGEGAVATWREDTDFGLGRESVPERFQRTKNGASARCGGRWLWCSRGV